MTELIKKKAYEQLIADIGVLLEEARKKVYAHINQDLVKTYWELGRRIVEYEQKGEERAEYGEKILDELSADLTSKYGKGFSAYNLRKMRSFYLAFPKWATVSPKLGWSHYRLILRLEEKLARQFYLQETEKENWSVRELDRQINSALFERIVLSKDKKAVLKLAQQGQIIEQPDD